MTTEIAKIWEDFHKELRAYVAKTVRNKEDTDDIMQDVFVKIIRNIEKVNKAENLRQYLYGIVKNAIRDYFNNQKHKNNGIPDFVIEEEIELLNSIIADRLKPFINQLPEKYKEALLITEFQNISQKELAEKLNISYSGAKSRVQRGKEKLKELLLACCAFQSDIYGNIIEVKQNKCKCL
ncbi:MAG: sigma-70 family RNA polymerase sigma factor [Bacteroidales bacterium]|nr:sigma-70 family RNA polymerase sigma factor [Bacteroidales bacterium]MDD4604585.1 sigma-70 family RNA polymerase sigma factor [Bacteroidales bacterium]